MFKNIFAKLKFYPALFEKKTIICLFGVQNWKWINFKVAKFVLLKNRLI